MRQPDNVPQGPVLPARDQLTALQVNTLLHTIRALTSTQLLRDEEGGIRDGGTLAAIETTVIKACGQLDQILDDGSRWTLANYASLEGQLSEVYAAHLAVLELQKETIAELAAPHRIALPKLCRIDDGRWTAIMGDPKDWDNCIIGIGESPAQALKNFDEVFNGLLKQQTEPKAKHEQQETVDDTGDGDFDEAPERGPELPADSGIPGADPGELPPEI